MSNDYNYSGFAGLGLGPLDESELYSTQLQSHQGSSYSEEDPTESRIENMLLGHSKYYVYSE